MALGRWRRHAYAISIIVLLHINVSLSMSHRHANVTTRCPEREKDALLAIKEDLVDEHNLLSSWGSEAKRQDCCRWKRVYCDRLTGHVTQLHLGALKVVLSFQGEFPDFNPDFIRFEGKLSPKIIELEHLEYLDLSNNWFNDSQIPALNCSLSRLRHLNLTGNSLSKIPELIGNLTNLRYLDLSWNHLGGEFQLYHQLGNLTHMQYLNLGHGVYGGVENLNWLSHLSSLKYLDLRWISLSKASDWMKTINNLPSLRNLTLSSCDLPPPILSTLSHINSSNSLVSVDLSNNPAVRSSIFKWLCNYSTTLAYLDLSATGFSGQLPYQIGYVDLSGTGFSGQLTQLQHLDLSDNEDFTHASEFFGWLPYLSSLKYLNLRRVDLSNVFDWAETLNKLPNLQTLILPTCQLPPAIISSTLPGKNTSQSLAVVDLSYNNLTSSVFKWLSNYNVATLAYLDLSHNEDFTDAIEFFGWLPHLSSLKYLDLSGVDLSNVFDWAETLNKLPNLQNLILHACQLPPAIISSTLSDKNTSQSLAVVDLSYNNLTSSVFKWLSNYNVATLDFLGLSSNILSGSLPDVFENMSSLSHLYLRDNELEGKIPNSFAKLCSLQDLDISSNNISGNFSFFIESSCAQSSLQTLYAYWNTLAGTFPDISKFQALRKIVLAGNKLTGTIPQSIGNMSKLEFIDLGSNNLEGVISEAHFSKLSKLISLDLSSNSLVLDFHSEWIPPFQQFQRLDFSSCKMGPLFPQWLQTQKILHQLAISDVGISDIIPSWFWDWSRNIYRMDLSCNAIKGSLEDSGVEYDRWPALNLSWNHLEGPIPSFLSTSSSLDLSHNKFSKLDYFLCRTNFSNLKYLDLSSNHISGELPDCWTNFEDLVFLDLSSNTISGKIPSTIGSLSSIITLKLDDNMFVGELPSSLKNCTKSKAFNLENNELSGHIPQWLGGLDLVILILRSNHFNGSLPSQLCHLTSIQVLDLSMNNISENIPKCLNNLTTLAEEGNSELTISHEFAINKHGIYYMRDMSMDYDEEISIMWKGVLSKYQSTLGLVKSIDFSSNRLIGEIPIEITHLLGLNSLVLAGNHLTGQISPEIGKLKSLQSLDLSRNQISGSIPQSLLQIYGLGYLNLSYNNLSGKIPMGTQLQIYGASSFDGNPQLCGVPLKPCNPEGTDQPNASRDEEDQDDELITDGFYISLGLGFVVGFWGVCGSLIFKRSWRYAYYKFLNALNDRIYVRAALIKRQVKDMLNRQL